MDKTNLKETQNDYAIFLPAISTFYSIIVSKSRADPGHVINSRVPKAMTQGVEGLNFLDPKNGVFYYPWALHSAGHANLDLTNPIQKEAMFRERPRNGDSWVLGDSGGFQIGKGVWEGDWKDPSCPRAQKKREQVLAWMDGLMDYGMILDIPAWVARSPKGQEATGISTYEEAVAATDINNEYFMKNRNGNCKFLNVLQGETHTDAEDWYQRMKKYCDPKQYPDTHFNGWAMGGQNMCDVHLVLKRLVSLRFDGLLEEGIHDFMHFLGTSKLEWAIMLTDIQRAVRKYHNPKFTITFDCASPFLANANGLIYTMTRIIDRAKWSYIMEPSIDDRKFNNDTRSLAQALVQEGVVEAFTDSPLSKMLELKDICTYAPGDVNKFGKVSKTSWDSFSYALQMAHNVWMHINAVQEANAAYDKDIVPAMLVDERFDRIFFRQIVEEIFSTSDRGKAEAAIEKWDRFYLRIIGTRGAVGWKTINSKTAYNAMFDVGSVKPKKVDDEFELDEKKLDALTETEND